MTTKKKPKAKIKLKPKNPDNPKEGSIVEYRNGGNVALELQAYKMGIQQQATKKMLDAANTALESIIDLAKNAEQESVKLKASQDLLDRVGLAPTTKAEIHHKRDVLDDMTDEELTELAKQYFKNKPNETVIEVKVEPSQTDMDSTISENNNRKNSETKNDKSN